MIIVYRLKVRPMFKKWIFFSVLLISAWLPFQESKAQQYPYENGVPIASRHYYINLRILSQIQGVDEVNSSDDVDPNNPDYLLLHQIYANEGNRDLMEATHVLGKITAIRGNTDQQARTWTVEVNTACANTTTKGSAITYNEFSDSSGNVVSGKLATVVFGDKTFIALEIPKNLSLHDFSFTGYALNQNFIIINRIGLTSVAPFPRIPEDPKDSHNAIDRLDPIVVHGHSIVSNNGREFYQGLTVTNVDPRIKITWDNDENDRMDFVLLHEKSAVKQSEGDIDRYVQGRLTAIFAVPSNRNDLDQIPHSENPWNRKWTIEVNSSSYNRETRGSVVAYNESTDKNGALLSGKFFSVLYNGKWYLALGIPANWGLTGISFTGYAKNQMLAIVNEEQIKDNSGEYAMFPKAQTDPDQPKEYLDIVTVHGPVRTGFLTVDQGAVINTVNDHGIINGIKVMSANERYSGQEGAAIWSFSHDSTNYSGSNLENADLAIDAKRLMLNRNTNGNVGVNVVPKANLHVNGTLRFDNLSSQLDKEGDIYFRGASDNLENLPIGDTGMVLTVGADKVPVWKFSGLSSIDTSKWKLSGNNILNKNTGNVGIGVTIPNAKLHVGGSIRFDNIDGSGVGEPGDIYYRDSSGSLAKLSLSADTTFVLTVGKNKTIEWKSTGVASIDTSKWRLIGTDIVNKNNGKVGIGTVAPVSLLHVDNKSGNGGLLIQNNNGANWLSNPDDGKNYLRGTTLLADSGGGKVGIGTVLTSDTGYKLFVEKGIRTRKVKVDVDTWPDYVFKAPLQPGHLDSIEAFIARQGHLPGVPSAEETVRDGLDLGKTHAILLEKIEELTLLLIRQKKDNDLLAQRLRALESKMANSTESK